MITEIKNRVLRIQMVHLTGTAKGCVELARARDAAALGGGMKLSKQHDALLAAAEKRLQAVET